MAGTRMMDMLRRSGGLDAISRSLGVPPALAAAGADALLPAIIGGFHSNATRSGGGTDGLDRLMAVLNTLGGGDLAANVLGPGSTDVERGNGVLAEIFGSKDVSRAVAAHGAEKSGIDAALLEDMLPLLSMLVGGYLSARAQTAAADGSLVDNLGKLLGELVGDKAGSVPTAPLSDGEWAGRILRIHGDPDLLQTIIAKAGLSR